MKFSNLAIQSKNLQYVDKFIDVLKKSKFSLIEIHNRPSYILHIEKNTLNNKYLLVIHNNPQTLRGTVTAKERKHLLKLCSKITFVSNWVKEKFFEGLDIKNLKNVRLYIQQLIKYQNFQKKKRLLLLLEN